MADAHTAAKSLLLAAVQDATVASAAGVTSGWTDRVLVGDKDGFIHQLHRGRLPAVELFQDSDLWTQASHGDGGQGTTTARWTMRVHSGLFDQNLAEEQCRRIAYAALIKIREQNYFAIGDDNVAEFNESPLGYSLTVSIIVTTSMGRDTYETTPSGSSGTVPDGGAVGGIRSVINYNDASPKSILALPAGQALAEVQVKVEVPFDGASPSITIGIDGDQERYLAAADSDLAVPDSVWQKDLDDTGPKTVKVWITPGAGATQGRVTVQLLATAAS